jgi:cysteine-rich repeat protein
MTLTCPANEVIVEIVFASYGLPKGDCGSFSQDACHAATSKSKVEALCLHKASCKIDANNATFGDPCKGADKRLFVEVKCGAPSPTCGDGALDPGEACDAGGAATMACSGTCGLTCAGGVLSDDNGSCYSTTGKKSWQAARDECVAKGAGCDLVVLETAAERSFLKGKFGSEAWVGAFKSDSGWQDMPAYTWVDFSPWTGGGPAARWVANNSNGGGPDGASWGNGEPNNVLSERCLRLKDSDLKLLSSNCNDTGQVGICECKVPRAPCNHNGKLDPGEECDDGNLENGDGCSTGCAVECAPLEAAYFAVKDPVSSHCYAALKQLTPWDKAGEACSALGPRYHLARVDSLAEFQFLSVASWARLSVFGGPGTPTLWLDGNDLGNEGSFVTSLGGPSPFESKKFPWATNEPNNVGEEDCLSLNWFALDGSTAYLLNDSNCGWYMQPLCERE